MRYLALLAFTLPLAACDFVDTRTGQEVDPVSKLPGHHEAPAAAPTGPSAPAAAAPSDAQRAYAAANDRMHSGMGQINSDADVAFMEGMIPHHQGAIDMADIALKYGKDAKVRDLASRVKAAQTDEIAEIRAWLDARKTGVTEAAAIPGSVSVPGVASPAEPATVPATARHNQMDH